MRVTAVAADLLLVGAAFLLQSRHCFFVAGRAPGLVYASEITDRDGLMSAMAGLAVLGRHGIVVRAMAFGTGRNLGMLHVAGIARHVGMRAAHRIGAFNASGMTADAGWPRVFERREIQIQRIVRGMAAAAVVQGIVRSHPRGVTVGTGGGSLLRTGVGMCRMAVAAVQALKMNTLVMVKARKSIRVAGDTQVSLYFTPGIGGQRVVRAVTGCTIIGCHGIIMRRMTIGAGRRAGVFHMTGIAGYSGVAAPDT